MNSPLLRVEKLEKIYGGARRLGRTTSGVRAVAGISFDLHQGETLGLVGESGSGKSTAGRIVLQLEKATGGRVAYRGQELTKLSNTEMKPLRRRMQIVFQDPYAALNPRMSVGRFVAEPMIVHATHKGSALQDRTAELFRMVGLDPSVMKRYPHQFSGGQRQRINIARAIACNPEFIVADEPITALDVSIQAQIINLFQDLQEQLGLSYLFVAHDLSMVRYMCDRVAVMLRGRIVELAKAEEIFSNPLHAYTRSLLSAIPHPDPDIPFLSARTNFDIASFRPEIDRDLVEVSPGHFVLPDPA
ncbi:ABC transporter ATP-binding protein [Brucella anthropi]|uniref:ABC transporter ATP-binding protein n=1 Tax=Brucella anthropi TaxID=529 RepID=UPI000DED37AD|nr:ATP-binding cassette domain-containing protein [Brucella anthropi]RCI77214.1 ABC transporter ATP-binding protein [Brucella anthropi]